MLDWVFNVEILVSLLTLTILEIILGIDNLVFLSVITQKVERARRARVQRIGLTAALVMRIAFVSLLVWITKLTTPVFALGDHIVSWRDIILLAGGLFLLAKSTSEIHVEVEGDEDEPKGRAATSTIAAIVVQIMLLDLVFSLDSVITAIGLTTNLPVMIAAITIAIGVMMFAALPVSDFIARHPSTKMLAFSFLLLIGAALVADALHFHVPRGYLYFAIGFSLAVEALNIAAGRKQPVRKGAKK